MSGNLVGAEAGQMQALSAKFTAESAQIRDIVSQITGQLEGTSEWKGSTRDNFVAEWPTHASNMQNLAALLDQCSADVKRSGDAIITAGGGA